MPQQRSSGPTGIWPAVIVAAASGAWGLYWLPLRALHEAGIPLAWVPALLYAGPALLLALAAMAVERSGPVLPTALTGLLAGIALAFYTDALLLTEVVRALIFFYLTPVWSTLLERMFLGIRVSVVRVISIVLGFTGIGIAVGVGSEDVLASINLGDLLALASGIAWAWATMRVYVAEERAPVALSAWFLAFGALVGIALAMLGLGGGTEETVDWGRVPGLAPWFLAFSFLVVTPSVFAMLWGAGVLSPGLVGILLMTEISVGAVSAALWAGEPVGTREWVGLTLITLAGVLEARASLSGSRKARGE